MNLFILKPNTAHWIQNYLLRGSKWRWHRRQKPSQLLSAAETYLRRNLWISEMCMVSLMAVSRLRTWSRPLSSVLSLVTTVNRTPIWSYLKREEPRRCVRERDTVRKQPKPQPEAGPTFTVRSSAPVKLAAFWGTRATRRSWPPADPAPDLHTPSTKCKNTVKKKIFFFFLKKSSGFPWDPGPVAFFLTCLSSTVAPLPISSATLTGAITGCNFST